MSDIYLKNKLYRNVLIDILDNNNNWKKEATNFNYQNHLEVLCEIEDEILKHDYKEDNRFYTFGRINFLRKEFTQFLNNNKLNLSDSVSNAMSNLEEDITTKVNELIDILIQSKYGSITFYYDNLYLQIINEYKNTGTINSDKIKLCMEIMNNYYDGVIGIDNFFNL